MTRLHHHLTHREGKSLRFVSMNEGLVRPRQLVVRHEFSDLPQSLLGAYFVLRSLRAKGLVVVNKHGWKATNYGHRVRKAGDKEHLWGG